ncbi:ALP1-like protein [Tanacetum coccineum]
MSDSTVDMSDLDDINDMEMIMQQLRRERDVAEERVETDYFGDNPKYSASYLKKRYRMSRKLFLEIVEGIATYIQTVDSLSPRFDFFRVRPDAAGQPSFSVIMQCTSTIRQLAYGETPDSFDEYLQMGDHGAHDCHDIFNMCVIELFMPKFLRKPDMIDIQKLYNAHNMIHGFTGMFEIIDCMYWEWKN